jgi:hypothetical protein
LWAIDRQAYRGPLLVQGWQVDGMDAVRFELGVLLPAPELAISPLSRDKPSTRIRGSLLRVRGRRHDLQLGDRLRGEAFPSDLNQAGAFLGHVRGLSPDMA